MFCVQVNKLQKVGVSAIRVGKHNVDMYDEVKRGKFRIGMPTVALIDKCVVKLCASNLNYVVLMAPETVHMLPWRDMCSSSYFKENLVLVAIDEVHCVSEW